MEIRFIEKEMIQTEEKNDLLFDLIRHLREQNRRQRTAFIIGGAALFAVFAGTLAGQNARWARRFTELMRD